MDRYDADGYMVIEDLLTPSEVDDTRMNLRRLIEEADDNGVHPDPGMIVAFEEAFSLVGKSLDEKELGIRKFQCFAERDTFFWKQVTQSRIREIADEILGSGSRMFQSLALVKPPLIGVAKEWHQDVAYFAVEPKTEVIGIWIALDDATLENGCMQLVPGSHKLGLKEHVQGDTGWQLPDDRIVPVEDQVLKLPMKAGTGLIFNSLTYHYTDHNYSDGRRRAIQYHYVSDATVQRESGDKVGYYLDSVELIFIFIK